MVTRFWNPAQPANDAVPVMERVSAGDLRDTARSQGYRAFLVEGTLNDIEHELQAHRPMIVGMAKPTSSGALGHYEVVVGLHRKRQLIATFDPALGARQYSFEDFLREWIGAGRPLLVVIGPPSTAPLVLEPVAGLEDPRDDAEADRGKP
jgi:predicted double-glycine peptidase